MNVEERSIEAPDVEPGSSSQCYHLAELNLARLLHPLDGPESAEFAAALEPVNMLAELAPGFIWRLTDDGGSSSSYIEIDEIDDPQVIVNLSIWTDVDSLMHFVMKSGHVAYFRRRKEWFEKNVETSMVCWWVPVGERPSTSEAMQRLEELRVDGPSDRCWSLLDRRPPPQSS